MRSVIAAACLLLSACSQAAPPYRTENDVKEVMGHVLDPAADVIWGAAGTVVTEEGEQDLSPTDEAGWLAVENAAAVVAESGNLLMLPGRAPENDDADWIRYSQQLHDSGQRAMKAAESKNKQGVFDVGGEIYQVCVACHQKYPPKG